jgi:hypothetical protein
MSNGAQAMGGVAPAVMPGASTYAPQVAPGPQTGSLGGGKGGAAGATPFQQSADAMRASLGGTGREMMYTPLGVQAGGGYKAATAGGGGQVGGNWGYDPTMIEGGGYSARQLAGQDLSSYMNPYEDQVVNQSLADIDRARQLAGNQADASAMAAGAFGGSRQAVMQAENNRNFLDQQARTASGLRQAGFQNAQQMALQDIGATNRASEFGLGQQMQASLANQGVDAQAQQFAQQAGLQAALANQNSSMQSSMANAAARNRAAEFGLTQDFNAQLANQNAFQNASGMRLNAAGQMAGLSDQAFGQGQQVQAGMDQQGALIRALQQGVLGAAQGQFGQYSQTPINNITQMLGAISGAPTGQTATQNPGLFDYLTLAANTAGSAASGGMFNKPGIT